MIRSKSRRRHEKPEGKPKSAKTEGKPWADMFARNIKKNQHRRFHRLLSNLHPYIHIFRGMMPDLRILHFYFSPLKKLREKWMLDGGSGSGSRNRGSPLAPPSASRGWGGVRLGKSPGHGPPGNRAARVSPAGWGDCDGFELGLDINGWLKNPPSHPATLYRPGAKTVQGKNSWTLWCL